MGERIVARCFEIVVSELREETIDLMGTLSSYTTIREVQKLIQLSGISPFFFIEK